ncbi:MAG: glutamate--tRNA ligase [Prevotellaceae bacterium]|jgi:glutamyl-tRNA synthetase|nr:glutamate--tRNA ligase [Prevotellaceae bacterium]
MENTKIRVRFAPSPTGALHIGGVRTALYNYLFAKRNGGEMVLRIEDTDSARFVEGAENYIIEALAWLGIKFDEGVSFGGKYAPYRQSERKEIYKTFVEQLLDSGKAYIAFDTPEFLDEKRAQIANFQYDASTRMSMQNSLVLPENEVKTKIANGEKYVVRFKIEPNEDILVNDLIRGEVKINSSVLDDKVLWKSADELPTYHLANIVDDHLMKITHVIRGEEWLPSAPLHVLLYRAFGWESTMPSFAHLPLLLKPDGKGKLSKRDGDRLGFPVFPLDWIDRKTGEKSSGYREAGYFPEALINFLALLGWNSGTEQEIFSMEELINLFSLERCSKSGAKFDYEKGKWFNHKYLQTKSAEELAEYLIPIFKQKFPDNNLQFTIYNLQLLQAIDALKERATFPQDLFDLIAFFFVAPETFNENDVKKRWKEDTAQLLTELIPVLESIENFDNEHLAEETVKSWCEEKNYNLGAVMNPFRLTLVGEMKGPQMFVITKILGKEETIKRLKYALRFLAHR